MTNGPDVHRASVTKSYSRLAPEYDLRWARYIVASTRETAARLILAPGERLLDVGCGTGALIEHLSNNRGSLRLFGVDPVSGMLAIARRKVPTSVALCQGWAEQLPFPSASFDAVVSCNVFHYLMDPTLALREMERVLRPGGTLLVTDWCDDYVACRLCGLYLRVFHRSQVRIYRSQTCIQMIRGAKFETVGLARYKISWLWGLMTATAKKIEYFERITEQSEEARAENL